MRHTFQEPQTAPVAAELVAAVALDVERIVFAEICGGGERLRLRRCEPASLCQRLHFDDGFTSGTGERVCRPGRGEGLADTANGLCLFQDVLPESVTQGDLGNW